MADEPTPVKVLGVISTPRYGAIAPMAMIHNAFGHHRIPLQMSTGAYWGQLIANSMQYAVDREMDFIVTADFDSFIISDHIAMLLGTMCQNPDIGALASVQPKRWSDSAL